MSLYNQFNLNLDNFDTHFFARDSPFVLTSSTSLEACRLLHINPSELEYHSLEEYEEDWCHLPLSEIYKLYEQNETARQEKVLKCQELRDLLLTHKPCAKMSKVKMRRYPSSATVNFRSNALAEQYGLLDGNSDTESTEDLHNQSVRSNIERQRDAQFSSRSAPDLSLRSASSWNVRKSPPATSPRHHCQCQLDLNENEVINEYYKRYEHLLSSSDLLPEDRKIMQRLILKKAKQMEWDKRSQLLRKMIEKERVNRMRENDLLTQKWHDRLSEKRRLENIENTRRYLQLEEKSKDQKNRLQRYLEERDKKVQKYLEDINFQKKRMLVEKHKQDAIRQLEVGNAVEKIINEDRQHRQMLQEKLERRMREADMRKRRREQDFMRHVSEMNRVEDVKRSLNLERLEQQARQSVDELRNQIEEKEHRAQLNYLTRVSQRDRALTQGAGCRNQAIEKARTIHKELLRGLDEWHKKVLELHIAAQERAQYKYDTEISRRRARVASDRILREERSQEMYKRVQDLQDKKLELVKTVIDYKDNKSEKIMKDKEHKVRISRMRAQHAAKLLQQLRDKLDPDTFDKKAARVEMELKVMRKPSSSALTIGNIRYHTKPNGRKCSCNNHVHHRIGSNNATGSKIVKSAIKP